MTWQLTSFLILALGIAAGFGWYERSHPSARVLALVAALAALAVVGRLAFAAFPNVKPTTDMILLAGYALGGAAGFAVGAITPLVSNIFLGHGPWTPWQMAAWGGVGVGGAVLARLARGRRLGRWQLAIACGLAGAAFGVVMDTYQWTLAAEQNLATWLAVSASSLPYNLAHVIGNVVFCLLIGPAFLRALSRYRRRFEVRWAPAAAAAGAVVLLALAPAASAASAGDRGAAWLARVQNRDGGYGGAPGQRSSPLFTGWASLGLAAAGRNPRDVARRGRSAIDFIRRKVRGVHEVGELERTILVAEAAGLSARRFGGRDLVARLERYRRSDGSFSGYVSYTAFGILARRSASAGGLRRSARWLAAQQNDDGGWGVAPGAQSDVDNTAAALQALAAARRGSGKHADAGVGFLRRMQNGDGGFGQSAGRSSNTQSSAFAVQGLVAAGRKPARFRRAGRSPLAYIRSLQQRDGSIRYSKLSAQTPVWVTAQAVMALELAALPLESVPRARARKSGAAAETAGAAAAPAASEKPEPAPEKDGGERARDDAAPTRDEAKGGVAGAAELGPPAPAVTRAAETSPAVGSAPAAGAPAPNYLAALLAVATAVAAVWGGARWRRRTR